MHPDYKYLNGNRSKINQSCIGLFLFVILLLIGIFPAIAQDEPAVVSTLEWQTEKLADGVYWKSYQGDDLNDAKLSINMVEIDLDTGGLGYKIAYTQNGLIRTSDFAREYDALAAVNGSFFDTGAGGSVVFLKADGNVISEGAVNRNPYTENGGIGWGNGGNPEIMAKPDNGWQSADLNNILSSGPLLIHSNEIREFNNDPFNQNRHPRTAVAITKNNRLLLVTVDGRSFQSYGMTIPELAQFLKDLGAVDALNLDGGGSTSMWIKGVKTDGIVNYPSDNLEFDHEGERGVSNALILIKTNTN